MMAEKGVLRDHEGHLVVEFDVEKLEQSFIGKIVQLHSLAELFLHYEQTVNDMSFSIEDELRAEIDQLGLVAIFERNPDSPAPVVDPQIYPLQGELSFSLKQDTADESSHHP